MIQEVVFDIDDGEKVPGGLGGEKLAQIHGNIDDHRSLFVPHRHAVVDGQHQLGGEVFRQGGAVAMGLVQQLPDGKPAADYPESAVRQPIAPQPIGRRFPGKLGLPLAGIILGKAVIPLISFRRVIVDGKGLARQGVGILFL